MQLEINGDKYGLIWGTRAFVITEAKLGLSLEDIILGIDDQDIILNVTYAAITNWVENIDESKTLPFSYPQFCTWFDQQPQELGEEIAKDYLASIYQGKTMTERYEVIKALYEATAETKLEPTKTVKKKKSQPVK